MLVEVRRELDLTSYDSIRPCAGPTNGTLIVTSSEPMRVLKMSTYLKCFGEKKIDSWIAKIVIPMAMLSFTGVYAHSSTLEKCTAILSRFVFSLQNPRPNASPLPSESFVKAYQSAYQNPEQSKPYHCHENVKSLIEKLAVEDPSSLSESEVLVLFRFDPQWKHGVISHISGELGELAPYRFTSNLVATNLREKGSDVFVYHVVLRHKGMIYDLSYKSENSGIPEREYFNEMFLATGSPFQDLEKAESAPLQERKRDKIKRYRFASADQMMAELRVRPIPALDYLKSYHDKFSQNQVRNPYRLWLEGEEDYKSFRLSQFLTPPNHRTKEPALPPYEKWTQSVWLVPENEVEPYLEYEGEVKVYANPENLSLAELQQIPHALAVTSPLFKLPEKFNRTDRSLEIIQALLFPKSMLSIEELRGKIVVDMATGGGLFVEELREEKIDAFGVDIALSPRQRQKMLHDTSLGNPNREKEIELKPGASDYFFIQAQASRTQIGSAQVDVIYETFGTFEYLYFGSKRDPGIQKFMSSILSEWKRILKVGGKIRISNIDESYQIEFRDFFNSIPGLKFVRFEVVNKDQSVFQGAIEIEKEEL